MPSAYLEGLLIAHFACTDGVVDAETAAAALRDAWRRDSVGPGIADRLAAQADLPPGRLVDVREKARRLASGNSDDESSSPRGAFGDRYQIVGLLGSGGMGVVYEAEDAATGRRVALKTLRRPFEPAAEFERTDDEHLAAECSRSPSTSDDVITLRTRLEREIRTCAQLEHPAVIPLYDTGRTRAGNPFYVMRLVTTRRTLRDAIRESGDRSALEPTGLFGTFLRVCDAVGYAHARGVLHRDLKPENIGLGEFGEVWVMDWGLAGTPVSSSAGERGARVLTGSRADRLTGLGAVGTPGYLPPELLADPSRVADARSDVYALGVILTEILTQGRGASAAGGGSRSLQTASDGASAVGESSFSGIPPDLVAIVRAARDPDPTRRPLDAGVFVAALRSWQEAAAASAARRERRRRGTQLVGALLLVLSAVAVYLAARFNDERDFARNAQSNAQAARDRAGSLLQFVLGDLAFDLDSLGLSQSRQDLLGRAQEFVESLSADGVGDQRLRAAWWIWRAEQERKRLPVAALRGWLERGRALFPDASTADNRTQIALLRGRAMLLDARLLADDGDIKAARVALLDSTSFLQALAETNSSDVGLARATADAYLLKLELRGDNFDTGRVALRMATEKLSQATQGDRRSPHEAIEIASVHLRAAEYSRRWGDNLSGEAHARAALEAIEPLAHLPVEVERLMALATSEKARFDLLLGHRDPTGALDQGVFGVQLLLDGHASRAHQHLALALADDAVRLDLGNGVLLAAIKASLARRGAPKAPLPADDEAVVLGVEYVKQAIHDLRQGEVRLRTSLPAAEMAAVRTTMRDLRESLRSIKSSVGQFAPLAGQDALVRLLSRPTDTDPAEESLHEPR